MSDRDDFDDMSAIDMHLSWLGALAQAIAADEVKDLNHPAPSFVGYAGDHASQPGRWARYRVEGRCRLGCSHGWCVETYDGPTVACECVGLAKLAARLDAAQLPVAALTVEAEWSDAHGLTLAQVERLAAQIRGGAPGRYGHGTVGTGKTWRSIALALALCRQGATVRWAHWPSFCEAARWAMDGGPGAMRELRRPLERCDVLFVDDLGQNRKTEWGSDLTDGVVGARAEEGRAIVATSNLDQAEMRRYLGERTWSRLTTVCVASAEGGPSIRAAAK